MPLAGTLVPGLSHLSATRPTAPQTPVEIDVTLSNPKSTAAQALYQSIYTPGDSDYHQFLTPEEYASEFAVPADRYNAAITFATAHGLQLTRSSLTRDLLVLHGTVGQAERTFGVQIGDYSFKGLHFFASQTSPLVPADVGIDGVIGLNTAQRMRVFNHAPAAEARHGPAPAQDLCAGPACVGGTTPSDLWSIYNQPNENLGEGETMAIFGEGKFQPAVSDLRLFEKNQKPALPAVPVKVVEVDGPTADYTDTSGSGEWDLDTQASTGMAPNVQQLVLYFGKDLTDASVLNSFSVWADDPSGPPQASASFGECEGSPVTDQLPAGTDFAAGAQYTTASEKILTQANIEGRTLFSSSGDTGSSCPIAPVDVNGVGHEAYPAPSYPADSPHAVSVGGTVAYTDGGTPASRVAEYGWTYTGGGSSFEFPEPKFQQGIAGFQGRALPCLYANDDPSQAGGDCRAVPDVAAQSGDFVSNGYNIYAGGQSSESGGTSLSSPLWMGMWTRIQAASKPAPTWTGASRGFGRGTGWVKAPPKGTTPTKASHPVPGGNGFADPVLYRHTGDFFDIGGGLSSPPDSNGYYFSQPGWDYMTGLGTPDITRLMQDIDGTLAPTWDVPSPNSPTMSVYAVEGKNNLVLLYTDSGVTTAGGTLTSCAPVFTSPAGDETYAGDVTGAGEPQADLIAGAMFNPSSSTLTTVLQVADLEPTTTTPGVADEYYLYWTSTDGTEYFTNVEISRIPAAADAAAGMSALPAITYNYGTADHVGPSRQYTTVGSVTTGQVIYGKGGKLEVTVPLSAVGSPTSALTGVGAETDELIGVPTIGGSLQPVDAAGPGNSYPLGLCRSDPTPAPSG